MRRLNAHAEFAQLLGAAPLLTEHEKPSTEGDYFLLRDGCSVWIWPTVPTLGREIEADEASGQPPSLA